MQNTNRAMSSRAAAVRLSVPGATLEGLAQGSSVLIRRWILTLVMVAAAVVWLLPVI